MVAIKELIQSADWKKEKHVPVIDVEEKAQKGEFIKVSINVGKEIPHPNTTEHHIEWIALFFLAQGEKFPYQVGRFEFTVHGASAQGINTSTVYTQPTVTCSFKTEKNGTLLATSYCNIHGIWESAKDISVE